MSADHNEDAPLPQWDIAFSEFSDAQLQPPTHASLNRITKIGRRLVASTSPDIYIECAVFNGDLGFTIDREEGDILHIVREGEDPDGETKATWYRTNFQNPFDAYRVSDGRVTAHLPFTLSMDDLPFRIIEGDEEEDIVDVLPESEPEDLLSEELLNQINAISGCEDTNNLTDALDTILETHGTKTQSRVEYHRLASNRALPDSVNARVIKRKRALRALQIAPRYEITLNQLMGARHSYWQDDVLRILENGSAEFESRATGDQKKVQSDDDFSFSSEVERRLRVQEALLLESKFGLQSATREQTDQFRSYLTSMMHYINLPTAR